MLQRQIFLEGEGKRWLERNEHKLEKNDAVTELVRGLQPKAVLEIGCSNGWRLKKLKEAGYCQEAVGIDPSIQGRYKDGVLLLQGTAESLPVHPGRFDCVIFGFCLYLCDPSDCFKIVSEADRVLVDGGWLIIHDFRHGRDETCYKTPYEHKDGLFSHHFDFAKLWAVHPAYDARTFVEVYGGIRIPSDEQITLLHKDVKHAFDQR